jgi:hypothetical protein
MGRSVEGLWVGKMATVSGLPNPLPFIIRVYGCSLAGSVSVVGLALVLRVCFRVCVLSSVDFCDLPNTLKLDNYEYSSAGFVNAHNPSFVISVVHHNAGSAQLAHRSLDARRYVQLDNRPLSPSHLAAGGFASMSTLSCYCLR